MEPDQYQFMFDAEDRHWWYVGNHEHFLELLRHRQILRDGIRMLDAGCGTGKWLQRLSNAATIDATGVDYQQLALDLAATRGSLKLQRGDLNTLELPDDAFDLITSFDVICNSNIDDPKLAARFHRWLKPGGYLLLTVPAYRFLLGRHDRLVHQNKRYRRSEIRKLMKENGFQIARLTYCVSLLFPLALLKRLFTKRDKAGDQPHNEVALPPRGLNLLLLTAMRFENFLLRFMPMPFGLSVMVLAKKCS